MKKLLLLLILVACAPFPEDIAIAEVGEVEAPVVPSGIEILINKEKSNFEFEGYGPGNIKVGTFTEWNGVLYLEDDQIIGGSGILETDSLSTGIRGLDLHLKSEDFFNAKKCPAIEFTSTSLQEGMMTGKLTMHCITKDISFPAEVTSDSVSADFLIDLTQWGIENSRVRKEARIAFTFSR